MFSGGTPPQRTATPRRASSRRVSRVAPAPVPASGQTTPRNGSPQPTSYSAVTPRALGMGLGSLPSRSLAGSPAPSTAAMNIRRKTQSSVGAPSEMGMDVEEIKKDDGTDKVLVRDENFVLLERKNLPMEVEAIILTADTYSDPFRASLDSNTGFAYLVSRDYCLVWNWSRGSSSTTTYIFPLPSSTSLPSSVSAFSPLAFACLVPSSTHQSTREPGLLITTTTGEIRYWESISMALSGVERFKSGNANLVEGELVRNITLLSPITYLLSTSQSRILCITLSSVGGRTDLSVRPFEKSVGWAGSVWGAVFGSKVADPRAGILALALSLPTVDGERVGYAVTDKDVQVWRLPNRGEGGERLAIQHDLLNEVIDALAEDEGRIVGNEEAAINAGKVEIVDAVVASNGSLAVLVSHTTEFTAPGTLSYAIVLLNVGTTLNSVTIAGVRHLEYEPHPDPRPLSSPKLSLPADEIAFVIFVDTLVMLSLSQTSLEETFPLRTNTNRFLGVSIPSSAPSAAQSLTLLTSTASLLTLEVAPTQGLVFDHPGSEGFETRKLKSKIEQAIFFEGEDVDNPLAFKVMNEYKGDLIAAATAVSTEILSSSAANMPLILDLKVQLTDRCGRAKALITFINSNGLLGKLSQTARRQLSIDAEQLSAVTALWQHQNARLGDPNSLLTNAIITFMTEAGEAFVEDPLRTFYRTKVRSIGAVLEQVTKHAKSLLASNPSAESRTATLQEANHIIILVFNAVNKHRKETVTLYGLDSSLVIAEPWSSLPELLESLQWHFDATDNLLRQRIREMGTVLDEEQANYAGNNRGAATNRLEQQAIQGELKKQMASLADYTFSACEERLTHLRSFNKESSTSPESRVLTERYLNLRSRFIHILVSIEKVTNAYDLAERYQDYRSLVELCNDSKHGSESRTRFFMQKYEEKFAFALYNFFVEKGLLRALLNQDELYRPLLTKFLDETDNSHISWLNDFAIRRYDHAADTLANEASKQKDLAQQKLLLSLSKLSEIAQVTRDDIKSEEVQRAIEAVDDRLDLVNSQHSLYSLFKKNLSIAQSRLSLDNQGEALTSTMAPSLHNRPAFAQLYAKFTKQLLQGQVLSAEDLIDLMTLKENVGEQSGDFGAAVEILVRSKSMPEARKEIALQNIWRRIYLHDNWEGLRSATTFNDEELSEALRSTALYASLIALAGANLPIDLYLEPQRSLSTATSEEIAARFPDLSAQTIDLILNDYELENQTINEALQHFGLLDFTAEVYRLFNNRDLDLEDGGDQME